MGTETKTFSERAMGWLPRIKAQSLEQFTDVLKNSGAAFVVADVRRTVRNYELHPIMGEAIGNYAYSVRFTSVLHNGRRIEFINLILSREESSLMTTPEEIRHAERQTFLSAVDSLAALSERLQGVNPHIKYDGRNLDRNEYEALSKDMKQV